MNDGRADFDFIFGRWLVRNRKLRDVTDPDCTEWVEFDATACAESILGGLGHVDRIWTDAPAGEEPFERGSPCGSSTRRRACGGSGGPPAGGPVTLTRRSRAPGATAGASSTATTCSVGGR